MGCAGFITLLGDRQEINRECAILSNTTNNESEIYAIKMGIYEARRLRSLYGENIIINIFSDSQISINGLRSWIFNWVNNIKDGIFIGSSGLPVKNQNIFIQIIDAILKYNIKVNLFHVRGHMNNVNCTEDFIHSFRTVNHAIINPIIAKPLMEYNDMVDKYTRKILYQNSGFSNYTRMVEYSHGYTESDLDKYKKLISINTKVQGE